MRVTLLIALLLSSAVARIGDAASPPQNAPLHPWPDGLALLITHRDMRPHDARAMFESVGGQAAVVVPPRCVLGWIPPGRDVTHLQQTGILHRGPVPKSARHADHTTRRVVAFFDAIQAGKYGVSHELSRAGRVSAQPDALTPSISLEEVERNLRALQHPNFSGRVGPAALLQNSQFMTGTVWVSLFFVESDGSGSDPNRHDWNESTEQSMFTEALSALAWWAQRARTQTNPGCWVAFYVQPYFATSDSRCWQWREPVLHSSTAFLLSTGDVLENFGFQSGDAADRATAFNFMQRNLHATDRAFCAFVATSPIGRFADDIRGRAFIGGPHFVQMRQNGNGASAPVFAHESGHMFGACDEYVGGCNCGPCNNAVENGNCSGCVPEPVPCMMRDASWNLCQWTPGHVGWGRNPCAPPPLPAPVLARVTPSEMEPGATGIVTLRGANFTQGTRSNFGPGIQILTERYPEAISAVLELSVEHGAAAGPRDVIVTTPDQQADTLEAGFAVVIPTDVHVLDFMVQQNGAHGVVLRWSLRKESGHAGRLVVLRSEGAGWQPWEALAELPLDARGFEDEHVAAGNWVYALLLRTAGRERILAERSLHVVAPRPSLVVLGISPNPFRASTQIRVRLGTAGPVEARIYDLRGRLVRRMRSDLPAGEGSIFWDAGDHEGRPQPSGTYICEVRTERATARARMTLVR